MNTNNLLLISDKYDIETEQMALAWEKRGGQVKRIGKFWVKPDIGDAEVFIYGGDSFALVLAQVLDLNMLMVEDKMIAAVGPRFLKRKVWIIRGDQLEALVFPIFLKPATPKLFKAKIFANMADFYAHVGDWEQGEKLIASKIIEIEAEVRSFILHGQIMDAAFYEGKGDLQTAIPFIKSFLASTPLALPSTFVLDIGWNSQDGWFIIEFNSSWGAGLNGCQADKILPCILEATQ